MDRYGTPPAFWERTKLGTTSAVVLTVYLVVHSLVYSENISGKISENNTRIRIHVSSYSQCSPPLHYIHIRRVVALL